MKKILMTVLMLMVITSSCHALDLLGYSITPKPAEKTEDEVAKAREKQIELFETLGILKTTTQVDASGSAIVLIMTKVGLNTYNYQHITTADSNNFESTLEQRKLIRPMHNPKTGKVERHILVFNPKDKHTYVWVPVTEAREVAKRIKETGKTIIEKPQPRRLNTDDIRQLNFTTSF